MSLIPARSKIQPYPSPEGCTSRFVATHAATSNENPLFVSAWTSVFGEDTGSGMPKRVSIRSRGWSEDPGSCLTSPGTVSSTHTCTGLGSAFEPNWSTIFITTFPPMECPMSILGNSSSFFSSLRTSEAAPSTELACPDVARPSTLAELPWHRRSTSKNCHAGFSLASFLAKPLRFLPEPRMPCTSTAVGTSTLEESLNCTRGPLTTSYSMWDDPTLLRPAGPSGTGGTADVGATLAPARQVKEASDRGLGRAA
mmetsp:Transcript_4003/g.12042  ORF Transcript_4003/g.12042 Transcript_4003/m.12042 type:complete len:254 (+) Transcript_4003:1492-2253(+)